MRTFYAQRFRARWRLWLPMLGVVMLATLAAIAMQRPAAQREEPRFSDEEKTSTVEFGDSLDLNIPTHAAQAAREKAFKKQDGRFPVEINRPSGPPTIEFGPAQPNGQTVTLACSTCHSIREPNRSNQRTADLDEFHQDMPFDHGELKCLACHNPNDYDTLHLADDSSVQYRNVMTLCAQCHGTQKRDYDHGAHGGMSGYWDRTRGKRVRNNCVDCHDPHVPKFPKMYPTFKPRDRFLTPSDSHEESGHD